MAKVDSSIGFPLEEYHNRLAKVRQRMKEHGVSLLLVDTPENVTYLTGFHTPGYYMYSCASVPLDGDVELVLRQAEMANARSTTWVEHLMPYDDVQDPIELVSNIARDLAGKNSIAVEPDSSFMTVNRFHRLAAHLGRDASEILDGSSFVLEERKIKSSLEVQYIKDAANMASVAMRRAVEEIEPGKTENDIAAAIFEALIQQGSEYLGMEPYINTGPRTGTVHASWQGQRIEEGHPVLIEIAGCRRRYHAALMRTVFVGSVSEELRTWSAVANDALNAAIEAIRPGVTSGEVDLACRGVIEKAGLYERFRKRTGYSIGLAYAPDWGEGHFLGLQRDDPTVLRAGMTFHMPPALREYGKYGFGVSETVSVTEDGCEVLTAFPDRLIQA